MVNSIQIFSKEDENVGDLRMKNHHDRVDLLQVPRLVQQKLANHELSQVEALIKQVFYDYPESPIPHNLMGLYWVDKRNEGQAVKHFRAAMALDSRYEPALQNIMMLGKKDPITRWSFY